MSISYNIKVKLIHSLGGYSIEDISHAKKTSYYIGKDIGYYEAHNDINKAIQEAVNKEHKDSEYKVSNGVKIKIKH